ncbi:T-lymphocyte surface antigen Ly-9-like isoform X2 [Sardina pilchardus]|uniref:T-lymphocyte surface antigen Ly-9-like isoform X2 n=1 Tax=Sardina pilchardus TaxID=27697 RepID=UPI002E14FB7F
MLLMTMRFLCFLVLILQPVYSSITKTKVYGLKGGSIKLLVNSLPMAKVTSIIWKHNKDKAAEWFEEDGESTPTYYLNYVDVTNLDMETWSLTISDLQPKFMGEYSAEVNNKDPSQSWDLIILEAVRKPTINKDFNSVCNTTSCTLTCEGAASQKLIWYDAGGQNISSDSTITVQRKDQDMEYTCQLSNEVSNATSSVKVPRLDTFAGGLMVVYICLGVMAGAVSVIGLILCIWRQRRRDRLSKVSTVQLSSEDHSNIYTNMQGDSPVSFLHPQ